MILGPSGDKLSKRDGAVSVLEYKQQGYLPDALLNYLARLGWSHGDQEIFTRQEMINFFQERGLAVKIEDNNRVFPESGKALDVLNILLAYNFGTTELGERLFGNRLIPAVGASGAIFALGGLLAMLTPKLKVLVFFIIPMPMWLAMTFFMGFFWILAYVGGIPIGNSAHLGGLVTGLIYGAYLKYRYPKKTRMISRFFS
jgi:hypothetical protein